MSADPIEGEGGYYSSAEVIRREREPWLRTTGWTPTPAPEGGVDEFSLLVRVDHPDGRVPALARAGDAGLDLVTSEATVVPVGQFRDVPCGISLQLPVGHWARITGRSSTLRKRGLLVNDAVIDNGYTGSIYVGVWNLGPTSVVVRPGERLAQLILHELCRVPVTTVEPEAELRSRDGRGYHGFGSTGK